jgi:lipoprotein-anchoring transpeptidase ErfK/SrfK
MLKTLSCFAAGAAILLGTEPGRIGYSTSDGCVRLTNWDAARLAFLVTSGTPVVFED